MSTVGQVPAQPEAPTVEGGSAAEELTGRLLGATVGAMDLVCMELGLRLGLYAALAETRGQTAAELAGRAGVDERYVQEWLQQQAVSALVDADGDDPATARFTLADGVAEVLLDETSPFYLAPVTTMLGVVQSVLPRLVDAYRTGSGVPYADYGPDAVSAQAALNRPAFMHFLTTEWLPVMADVDARLRDAARPARVADVGCGAGWSSIEVARAYPHVQVDGVDEDDASISRAVATASSSGVEDRVHFAVQDAAGDWAGDRRYDLVLFLECLHDMAHPAAALHRAREALAPGGAVLVMDMRAAESFTAPADEIERFFAGASVTWCLPQSRTAPDSAAIGTLLRPARMRSLADEAGFSGVDVLPIDYPFWRFYRLLT
jgi:2-polyprenyl-3-methyl-5-hydroxy-6-metoxy-1,4-benzoquinol methylase